MNKLVRMKTPKPVIMAPDSLLIHSKTRCVTFLRSKLTLPLRISHHRAEPENTLNTSSPAEP